MGKTQVIESLGKSMYLPCLPKSVSEIFYMLQSPNDTDIDELVKKVSGCNNLDNLMISNINSGYFQLKKKVSNLREAVIYLGMHTVQVLLIAFITRTLLPEKSGRSKLFSRISYWKHCMGTSIASCKLAAKVGICDKYELFAYGLVHDIGIAVLDTCLPEVLDEVFTKVEEGTPQIIAEKEVMGGLTHSDIGAWICEKWGLPENIRSVVEYHHKPLLTKQYANELKLVHVGDSVSTAYYEKLLGLNIENVFNRIIQNSIGISDDDIQQISSELSEDVEKVGKLFVMI